MLLPGANRSRQFPKSEYEALASSGFVAPTVSACGALAGDELHASCDSLPAATAYVTPALIELWTASLSAVEAGPPRLRLATAGSIRFRLSQSMAAMTPL